MGCMDDCAKYFLFLTNLIVFALSWGIMGLGIWILVSRNSFLDLLDDANVNVPIYESAVVLFLIVASVTILVSCLGCCGAYKESKCMLIVYFVVVLGLLVLIIVGTIIGMTQGTDKLKQPFLDTLSKYDEERPGPLEATWDQTQKDLHCCGVSSPADWARYNERYGEDSSIQTDSQAYLIGSKVPASCCAGSSSEDTCRTAPTGYNGAYVVGCWALIEVEVQDHVSTIGGVAVAVILILTVNMIIAFYMCACGMDSDIDDRPRKRAYGRPSGRV